MQKFLFTVLHYNVLYRKKNLFIWKLLIHNTKILRSKKFLTIKFSNNFQKQSILKRKQSYAKKKQLQQQQHKKTMIFLILFC